jgi:hypothetical protein
MSQTKPFLSCKSYLLILTWGRMTFTLLIVMIGLTNSIEPTNMILDFANRGYHAKRNYTAFTSVNT